MFQGYLIKFGDDILPLKYILYDTFKSTPNQRLDLDSYQDQLGVLNRNALDHTATKIEWDSPMMEYADFKAMMNFFYSKYTVLNERKFYCTYYDFETDEYKTGNFYMPDYQVQLYNVSNSSFLVNEVTFKLIEY